MMDKDLRQVAYNKFRRAVIKGVLKRPSRCQGCRERAIGRRRLHGHHEDYAKPLDVMWLCAKCHHERHRELNPGHPFGVPRRAA